MISNPSICRIGHIERLPLKTPYPAQIARIDYIINHLPRSTSLIVDFTRIRYAMPRDIRKITRQKPVVFRSSRNPCRSQVANLAQI